MTEIIYTIESLDEIFEDLKRRYTELLAQGYLGADYDYITALSDEKNDGTKVFRSGRSSNHL